jgi:hypothetical protein
MTSTKTVFLDFDGVLHSNTAKKEELFNKNFLLEELISQHLFEVVISSTWRSFYKLNELLLQLPPTVASHVVGVTGKDSLTRLGRYNEILAYVELHDIKDWRALDDSVIEFPNPCPQLVACHPGTGLTPLEIEKLQDWLMT